MKLKRLVTLISPRFGREPSVCESCGEEFQCGATLAGCWCSEIKLSEATRAELRTRFRGCLCRACLERFAAGEKHGGSPTVREGVDECGVMSDE